MLQVDHAVPVARGGGSDDDNLVASCVDCNLGKRDRIVSLPAKTFLGWLRLQKLRDDLVGDLARDCHELIEPASFKHLARQARQLTPDCWWELDGNAIYAAWHAWREYRRGGKPTLWIERQRARIEEGNRRALLRPGTAVWGPSGRIQ